MTFFFFFFLNELFETRQRTNKQILLPPRITKHLDGGLQHLKRTSGPQKQVQTSPLSHFSTLSPPIHAIYKAYMSTNKSLGQIQTDDQSAFRC